MKHEGRERAESGTLHNCGEQPAEQCMAERFVKTMKEDYIAFLPKPDVRTALQNLAAAFTHYNENHPHSELGYNSRREYRGGVSPLRYKSCPRWRVKIISGSYQYILGITGRSHECYKFVSLREGVDAFDAPPNNYIYPF